MLNITKTRTTPYHPQCNGQVEQINRTIIDLLKLNVRNPTENWEMEIGLVLIVYRSAIHTSSNFTSYFMLYGREMRLPLDIMYRPPGRELLRAENGTNVHNTLEQAHDTAHNQLMLANKRQKITTIDEL